MPTRSCRWRIASVVVSTLRRGLIGPHSLCRRAFFNDLAEHAGRHDDEAAAAALGGALETIEESRGTVRLKFLVAVLALTGKPADKGGQPYQDLTVLFRVRDEIVHCKPHGHRLTTGGVDAEPKKLLATLHSMKLIDDPTVRPIRSFFAAIGTVPFCKWAVGTARATMRHVVKRIPEGDLKAMVRMLDSDDLLPSDAADSA